MYITISPQKLTSNFSKSVGDFVAYLEKENLGKSLEQQELFFNQYDQHILPEAVIKDIDGNVAKLKSSEPKYYSITINPSKRELVHLQENPTYLKSYTREIMKEYASAFNREINGRPITVDDIKYFAKIEQQRTFKGTDREIKENAPFIKQIARLENEIRKVMRGEISGSVGSLKKELQQCRERTTHKINGEIVDQGMMKPGLQTHVHIIVSRKDTSNSHSLSPGSRYRSSEVVMHGKTIKRGFDRDRFFDKAEKTFDRMFNYDRNYVESYGARKLHLRDPQKFYSHLNGLSVAEKRIAFMLLAKAGVNLPHLNISPNQITFALKQIKKALALGIRSSSIGY